MSYKLSYVQNVMLFVMTCFDPYPSVLYGYYILYIGVIIVNICMHRNAYLSFLDMPRKP